MEETQEKQQEATLEKIVVVHDDLDEVNTDEHKVDISESYCDEKKDSDELKSLSNVEDVEAFNNYERISDETRKKRIEKQDRYIQRGHSKVTRSGGRFATTWVQYEDGGGGLGFAYGGADPLNYEPSTRNRFVRIILLIVLFMIMFLSLFNLAASKLDLQSFFKEKSSFMIVVPCIFIYFGLNYAMTCFLCTRRMPCNYISLVLSLITFCIMTGSLSGQHNSLLVTYSIVSVFFSVLVCTFLACTGFDFTKWYLYFITLPITFAFIVVFAMISHRGKLESDLKYTYSVTILIVLVVATVYLMMTFTLELQLILSSSAVELSEEDYALGAFYLFTSPIDVYLKILQACGL